MAFERAWPDPEFIQEVEEAFPEQGIANVEEARVCYGPHAGLQVHRMWNMQCVKVHMPK